MGPKFVVVCFHHKSPRIFWVPIFDTVVFQDFSLNVFLCVLLR